MFLFGMIVAVVLLVGGAVLGGYIQYKTGFPWKTAVKVVPVPPA
jgi:hypothetical protein